MCQSKSHHFPRASAGMKALLPVPEESAMDLPIPESIALNRTPTSPKARNLCLRTIQWLSVTDSVISVATSQRAARHISSQQARTGRLQVHSFFAASKRLGAGCAPMQILSRFADGKDGCEKYIEKTKQQTHHSFWRFIRRSSPSAQPPNILGSVKRWDSSPRGFLLGRIPPLWGAWFCNPRFPLHPGAESPLVGHGQKSAVLEGLYWQNPPFVGHGRGYFYRLSHVLF